MTSAMVHRTTFGLFCAFLVGACGGGAHYSRSAGESGGEVGGTGSGGNGSGGRPGSGGRIGTGGVGSSASGGRAGTGAGGGGGGGRSGVAGSAMAGASGPQILSIDFVGAVPTQVGGAGGTLLTPIPMGPTEMAGVKTVSSWNSAPTPTGTLAALRLADGTTTTASVTWSSPPTSGGVGVYGVGLEDAVGNARMMNGYLDPTSPATPATIVVSGLPPAMTAGGYDVYVYTLGHLASGTRTYSYTIGASTITVSQTGPSPTIVPGFTLVPNTNPGMGNYVIFRNLTDASFTLTATPTTGVPRAPVNGIQIVSPTGS
jgi:hypothetical protein